MSLLKYSELESNKISQSIAPWVIKSQIGRGSTGVVFEIENKEGAKAALKVIRIPADDEEIRVNRAKGMSDKELISYYKDIADNIVSIIRQIRSFGSHKNIVRYGNPAMLMNDDGISWTVLVPMELLSGLSSVFPSMKRPERKEVIRFGMEVCSALQICHDHKLLHRDIKPANILVDKQGTFKIVDFGIARVKEKTITSMSARGTENYMAPEVIRKEKSHSDDFSSDIYSLGFMLFQLLNDGRLPTTPDFPSLMTGSDEKEFILRKMNGDLPMIAKFEEGMLMDIIAKACHLQIGERYRSAEEMKADLQKALEEEKSYLNPQKIDFKRVFFGHYPHMSEDDDEFFFSPMEWFVLKEDDEAMLLLSEKIIDTKAFHEEKAEITWEKSTLRSWLNGYGFAANDYGIDYSEDNFLVSAFEQEEIDQLIPLQGDRVSLLAEEDVYGTAIAGEYGFCSDRTVEDPNREALATSLALNNGLFQGKDVTSSVWWLKTQGTEKNRAMFVDRHGVVACNGAVVYERSFGVRPVIMVRKNKKLVDKTVFKGWNYILEETDAGPVRKRLGKGGYGTVFEIEKEGGEEQKSALKIISIPKQADELNVFTSEGYTDEQIARILEEKKQNAEKEIKQQIKVQGNQHIVSIEDYAVREKDGSPGWDLFIRMKLLRCINLEDNDSFSPDDVRRLGIDICSALEECHGIGILHRDITPGNIFLDEEGRYELGDFGIARTMGTATAVISVAKTDRYAAPEVIRLEKHRATADIYSLGIVMYELLNHGRMPFLSSGKDSFGLEEMEEAFSRRVIQGEPIEPIAGISDDLNAVVLKACAYDPKDRFQSAGEMKRCLEMIIDFSELEALLGSGTITVVGVGGAGCNSINRMIEKGDVAAKYIAVNTDQEALSNSKADQKILIGRQALRGLGANGDPLAGRNAVYENIDDLRHALAGSSCVIVKCGLGGGTGTGAAPVICKLAKEAGAFVFADAITPFKFEGKRRNDNAKEILWFLYQNSDITGVTHNDALINISDEKASLQDVFAAAEEISPAIDFIDYAESHMENNEKVGKKEFVEHYKRKRKMVEISGIRVPVSELYEIVEY